MSWRWCTCLQEVGISSGCGSPAHLQGWSGSSHQLHTPWGARHTGLQVPQVLTAHLHDYPIEIFWVSNQQVILFYFSNTKLTIFFFLNLGLSCTAFCSRMHGNQMKCQIQYISHGYLTWKNCTPCCLNNSATVTIFWQYISVSPNCPVHQALTWLFQAFLYPSLPDHTKRRVWMPTEQWPALARGICSSNLSIRTSSHPMVSEIQWSGYICLVRFNG